MLRPFIAAYREKKEVDLFVVLFTMRKLKYICVE